MGRPIMLVVAGPPGSGKSTVFPVTAFGVDAFSIDDRCAQLVGSYRAIPRSVRDAVSEECRGFIDRHIHERQSFAVETTLRTVAAVRQASRARASGFLTEMRFLATSSSSINVERVTQRAQSGGHAASEREIRSSYDLALTNLREAIRTFERCNIYDASERWAPPRLVGQCTDGALTLMDPTPDWLDRALAG